VSKYDYDLFVIGAGSGGVRAGRLAAQLGKNVAVAEESKPGGTCVVRGCVPKKYLVYGADYGSSIKDSQKYGWSVGKVSFDWKALRDSIQNEVNRLSGIYKNILEKNGATLFRERAEFLDEHTLVLKPSGRKVTAKTILIATGGRPWMPNIPGGEHAIMSDDAFLLEALPEKVLIIGGGYIASEFAGIYSGMGMKVVQAYRGDKLLNGFDDDVREETGLIQANNGIETRFKISPTDKAGVKTDKNGAVIVDPYSKSSVKNIYAVGDVTNRVNLTPVAIREGAAFIETVFKGNPTAYDHSDIASAVFTRPPIGVVGLTEAQARKAHGNKITVYETRFRPMKNVLAQKDQRCYMKLITHGKKETVIGIHIVGDDSPEIIQALGICVKAGLTKADFDRTCAVHPTLAEEIVTLSARQA